MFTGAIDQVSLWSEPLRVDRIWNTFAWPLGSPSTR
jgi:hypothetical protein